MTLLEIALFVTSPLWLIAADLAWRDPIQQWWRRLQRNRARRLARRIDTITANRYRAVRRISGGRSL